MRQDLLSVYCNPSWSLYETDIWAMFFWLRNWKQPAVAAEFQSMICQLYGDC